MVSAFEGSERGLAMGIYMTGPAIGAIVSLTLTNSSLPIFEGIGSAMLLWSSFAVSTTVLCFFCPNLPQTRAGTN